MTRKKASSESMRHTLEPHPIDDWLRQNFLTVPWFKSVRWVHTMQVLNALYAPINIRRDGRAAMYPDSLLLRFSLAFHRRMSLDDHAPSTPVSFGTWTASKTEKLIRLSLLRVVVCDANTSRWQKLAQRVQFPESSSRVNLPIHISGWRQTVVILLTGKWLMIEERRVPDLSYRLSAQD